MCNWRGWLDRLDRMFVVLGIFYTWGRCVIRGEFGKNIELFVRVRGYGVCGGTRCRAWGVGGGGCPRAKLYLCPHSPLFCIQCKAIVQCR
jgi:hypothetical protein